MISDGRGPGQGKGARRFPGFPGYTPLLSLMKESVLAEQTNVSVLGLQASFGFGDRIGLATPGHVEAMRRAGRGIAPIFAQQSIREMGRTNRTPEQVMGDALDGA